MNPRIVEREVKIEHVNTPMAWSTIGELVIDDNFYSLDDTLKVEFKLDFEEEQEADEDILTRLRVLVREGIMGCQELIYDRSLREHNMSGIFKRYRVPFYIFEFAKDRKEQYGLLDKIDVNKSIYNGNPNIKLDRNKTIIVQVLSPLYINKSKSKVILELKENRSHPTEKEIVVR